jgi:hypothetical protein
MDETITYSWTPLKYGTYNFSGYAPQIAGEFYTVNNIETKIIHILELRNYTMNPNYEYHWVNASGGAEWFLADDGYVPVSLPFDFQFYDDVFSTQMVILVSLILHLRNLAMFHFLQETLVILI